jgi:hypothetical protein
VSSLDCGFRNYPRYLEFICTVVVQKMAMREKRKGRPRGGSNYKLKQLIANRAEAPKGFGDLPEILQLEIFEMARVEGGLEMWNEDVRTPIVLRAVCKRWKRLIDFADDPAYHPEYSYYIDSQLRDIGGSNEENFGSAWRSMSWTIEHLRREFLEW